jgi:hypothetical protein
VRLDPIGRRLYPEADSRDTDAERRRHILRVGTSVRDVLAPEIGAPVGAFDAESGIEVLLGVLDVQVVYLPVLATVQLGIDAAVPFQVADQRSTVFGARRSILRGQVRCVVADVLR